MNEQQAGALVRALRRASGYVRLYGFEHPLCAEAVDEAAQTATDLVGDRAGILLGVSEDTLFVDGEAAGLISLQFNSFLREVTAAGVETVILTPPVDPGEVGCGAADPVSAAPVAAAPDAVDRDEADPGATSLPATASTPALHCSSWLRLSFAVPWR